MADAIVYGNCYVTFDNKLLTEAASISVSKKSNLNPVMTLAKGFSGMSLGAGTCEVSIETNVPSADFEVNPDPFMITGKQVEVGVVMANRQMTAKMFITDADYSKAVNQEAKLSIKLTGPLTGWE